MMTRAKFGLALRLALLLVVLPVGAQAAKTCSAQQKAAGDTALSLTADGRAGALAAVFPWGPPAASQPRPAEQLLIQADYVIDYDADLFGPVWSADVLGVRMLEGGRLDCFRSDPRLDPKIASAPADFDEPIFDQGHMVSNADMTFSPVAIVNSFLMSNMSPQFCQFNRGIWEIAETLVRQWSLGSPPLYVVNGAIFDRDGDGVRDPDDAAVRMESRNHNHRVALPSAYYKLLAVQRPDGALETLTILLPHDQTDVANADALAYLQAHITTVSAVEALTGVLFFPGFTGARRDAAVLWDSTGAKIESLVAAPCRKTAGATITGSKPAVYALP